jgi:hypothetical protein
MTSRMPPAIDTIATATPANANSGKNNPASTGVTSISPKSRPAPGSGLGFLSTHHQVQQEPDRQNAQDQAQPTEDESDQGQARHRPVPRRCFIRFGVSHPSHLAV